MRAHGGSDGGSGWFGGGVAAAPLPLPYCFGVAFFSLFPLLPLLTRFFSFFGSFVEMLMVVGPSSSSSLRFSLQHCSPLFSFPPSAFHGAVVD